MKDITTHLKAALAATEAGDHAKARHHIGHAFRHSTTLSRNVGRGLLPKSPTPGPSAAPPPDDAPMAMAQAAPGLSVRSRLGG